MQIRRGKEIVEQQTKEELMLLQIGKIYLAFSNYFYLYNYALLRQTLCYGAASLRPSDSACFFAFSRRSAMLEFLLCAAASAARLSGYWGIENRVLEPLIAAAYCTKKILVREEVWSDCRDLPGARLLEAPGRRPRRRPPQQPPLRSRTDEMRRPLPSSSASSKAC